MPLPSVLNGAKQCQVLTKRTRLRCKNPAAYGCRSCRMHGAHQSRNVLKGASHPQYVHGNQTRGVRTERSMVSLRLHRLEEIGWHICIFAEGSSKMRGRKPAGYVKLDLDNPDQLMEAIIQSSKEIQKKS